MAAGTGAERLSITCTNVPDGLFDGAVSRKHFCKFGRVIKIILRPKKHMCVVDYEQHAAAEKALLNAGAFDGYMFDVTWTKRKKKRLSSKKEDDPDWVPDTDVEEELTSMSSLPAYRQSRQQPMQQDTAAPPTPRKRPVGVGRARIKEYLAAKEKKQPQSIDRMTQPTPAGVPSVVAVATTLSTTEAAAELRQLRQRISKAPDEQRRTLDARDRVLRAWGGTGARVKVGGATIGTCPDMCPEKERLQRQAEHQVMSLEAEPGADGAMSEQLAVKQYSRSSADQEMPMCYELRSPRVLSMTMAYLVHEIADTPQMVSLADWFHFMWDRCRGIRKDITQQALCCAESVRLVEQCARFHAHCAARLADLEHTQFDQRLNTDNLTKCLQTLKHMYTDLGPEHKPREAEFRGYVALLNLGDANFWWEIKQLPQHIQKSPAITFAVRIFTALDNNNYIRFFRLIRDHATYLQACILLRYFNDVRARGLARIVKAFAPRGGSRYPVEDLMENLAFEDIESLKLFIEHYGLHMSRHDVDLSVILDRNKFIEDSDPYPISRAISLIESKRNSSVGEIIAGGVLPERLYENHTPHSSFNENGMLKQSALLAEDQGYSTRNESNKDMNVLKKELERASVPDLSFTNTVFKSNEPKVNLFAKAETRPVAKKNIFDTHHDVPKFSFTPAIPVVSNEVVKSSPEKLFSKDTKSTFSFSKPEQNRSTGLWGTKPIGLPQTKTPEVFFKTADTSKSLFGTIQAGNASQNLFQKSDVTDSFIGETGTAKSVFGRGEPKTNEPISHNLFVGIKPTQNDIDLKNQEALLFNTNKEESLILFKKPDDQNIFMAPKGPGLFPKASETRNLFAEARERTSNLFTKSNNVNIFAKAETGSKAPQDIFNAATKEPINEAPQDIFRQAAAPKSVFGQTRSSIFGHETTQLSVQPIFGKSSEIKPIGNLFASGEPSAPKSDPISVFGVPIKGTNLFTKPIEQKTPASSPTSLFKNAITQNQDVTNPAIFGSNKLVDATFAPLVQSDLVRPEATAEHELLKEQQRQEELSRQQEHLRRQEERNIEEARRLEEQKRLEEQRLLVQRQEEERKRQEEQRRLEVEKLKQEELRNRIEEEKRQAELKRIAEEKRKAEEERRKEEERRRLLERIDKESAELVEELTSEISSEIVKDSVSEEMAEMRKLVEYGTKFTNELTEELTYEICYAEIKAEKFLSEKLMEKYTKLWRVYTARNIRRRNMVHETPVWLSDRSPLQEANFLKRNVLSATLAKMRAFHRGHMFTGEIEAEPIIEPYNIIDVARSSLLKGLKNVDVKYHDCFFWKVTISSPGERRWLHKRLNLHDWLLKKFSDKDYNSEDQDVVYLKRHSWNNLMQFAISVSLVEYECCAAKNGSNGLLFYSDGDDMNLYDRLNAILQNNSTQHNLPLAVITPNIDTEGLETYLTELLNKNIITKYKVYQVKKDNTIDSVDSATKSALRWLARHVPNVPPLEIDSLYTILMRCVGTEFWYRLKLERKTRLDNIFKDLNKLTYLFNTVLEKLIEVITDEDIFSYQNFPSELKQFLVSKTPYPRSYEFFPQNWRDANLKKIKSLVNKLILRETNMLFYPQDYAELQTHIHEFCNQIHWFDNPKQIAYKIISHLPNEFSNVELTSTEFIQYFEQYDFLDMLNFIVIEKINCTDNFRDKMVVYDKTVLDKYRNTHWWYELEMVSSIKHKALEYKDDYLDHSLNESFAQNAKRMKMDETEEEILALEDIDETKLENSLRLSDAAIARYDEFNNTLKELEERLELHAIRAANIEEMLRKALNDV